MREAGEHASSKWRARVFKPFLPQIAVHALFCWLVAVPYQHLRSCRRTGRVSRSRAAAHGATVSRSGDAGDTRRQPEPNCVSNWKLPPAPAAANAA